MSVTSPNGQQPETNTPVDNVPSDYVATESFDRLPLSESVLEGIRDRGYTQPTPVQAAVIRPILAGRDLIVRSKTGTGKTAAFGIPLVEAMDTSVGAVQALVLVNTRELALQVATEITELGKKKGVKVVAIYGGASMDAQLKALADGAQIAVGTPGRLLDLLERRTLSLAKTRIGVLDEADEMLGMGFYEDVMRILGKLPKEHQTLLFSATVSPEIEQIVQTHLRDPETILLSGDTYTVEGIRNVVYFAQDAYPKPRNLLYMLQLENPENAIVFCNTRDDVNLVTTVLNRNGFDADKLSGELPQKERERVMAKIKRGEVQFMVATDLAARGIDISDLTHVINYSLPEDPAVYLHRIGRTGRIGKTGTALSLVRGTELVTLTALQRRYGIEFEEKKLPTPEEARQLWTDKHVEILRGALGTLLFDAYLPLAQELKKRDDGDILLAFALKYFFANYRKERLAESSRAEESQTRDQGDETSEKSRGRSGKKRRSRDSKAASEEGASGVQGEGKRPRRKKKRATTEANESTPVNGSDAASADQAAPAQGEGLANGESKAETSSTESKAGEGKEAKAERPARKKNRLYVSLGTASGLDETALRTAVAELAGVSEETIVSTRMRDSYSYVDVDPATVDSYLGANGREFQGSEITIEIARPPRRKRR